MFILYFKKNGKFFFIIQGDILNNLKYLEDKVCFEIKTELLDIKLSEKF